MALANGGFTEKLKYGHRGANQPVYDISKDRVFVTTQNHGYAVDADSIPREMGRVSHYNVNDKSLEQINLTSGNLRLTAWRFFTSIFATRVNIRSCDTSSTPRDAPSQAYTMFSYHRLLDP